MAAPVLSVYSADSYESKRDLTLIKIGAYDESTPSETLGYIAGSIQGSPDKPAKLSYIKVEDHMQGRGIAGYLLRSFAVYLKNHGVNRFESELIRPEALKAMQKVFPDEAVLIFDYFSKKTRNEDGSPLMLPMTIDQALMSGYRMRQGVLEEDWVRHRYLGAVINLGAVDTSSWQTPADRPWEDW